MAYVFPRSRLVQPARWWTVVIYMIMFFCFASAAIARPYPTGYDNLFWGFLQGLFLPPSFVWSLFNSNIAIYQMGATNWYDLGFMVGVVISGTWVMLHVIILWPHLRRRY
jgi:hypothetical protein